MDDPREVTIGKGIPVVELELSIRRPWVRVSWPILDIQRHPAETDETYAARQQLREYLYIPMVRAFLWGLALMVVLAIVAALMLVGG